ncbi:hypothetical protein PMAYCL1PPCAC_19638, partial [Pristionchus mayeri]
MFATNTFENRMDPRSELRMERRDGMVRGASPVEGLLLSGYVLFPGGKPSIDSALHARTTLFANYLQFDIQETAHLLLLQILFVVFLRDVHVLLLRVQLGRFSVRIVVGRVNCCMQFNFLSVSVEYVLLEGRWFAHLQLVDDGEGDVDVALQDVRQLYVVIVETEGTHQIETDFVPSDEEEE